MLRKGRNQSQMCEWLAFADWCDVRLMCGGHFFNAHRAVLASVSSFLRRVLLSCPVDELPVIIFLPEFDVDAMSSVLHYIYNGEVWIPNHKIKMFLDIVNAMKIFIEKQYIHQIGDKQYCFEPEENYNMCKLSLCNSVTEYFINVRKGIRNEELTDHAQKPIVSLEACDKFGRSEANISNSGNLKSRSRQKQSLLREIFMENVRQEGNDNGRTPGVLEITNEEYRAQKSGVFSNAVVNYPSDNKILSDTSKKILTSSNPGTALLQFVKQLYGKDYEERSKGSISISYTVYDQLLKNSDSTLEENAKKEYNMELWNTHKPLEISVPLLSRDFTNFRIKEQNSSVNLSTQVTQVTQAVKHISQVPKVTILNEVLQNPWHPRQPHSYRPFRKKDLISTHVDKSNGNKTNLGYKDNNNNSNIEFKSNVSMVRAKMFSEQQEQKCTNSQKGFKKKQDYTFHMKQHSSMNRYSCGECQKTFSQHRNFKYHMSVHRGTKEFAATCSVCGKHFNDRGYLSNHMKIHRNRKEYKCASCPKSFNQRVAFNMHVRIHTGVKPHVCEECGKAFSRKMLLKQHLRTHTGERPYACSHCDKRFADRSNMTLHLRLHTGVKPFSCTLCSKSFTKKHHLKSHLNFHTGAKPYTCPSCKLTFTQSSNMRTHYKKCNATSSNTGLL